MYEPLACALPRLGVAGQEDADRCLGQEDGHRVVVDLREELAWRDTTSFLTAPGCIWNPSVGEMPMQHHRVMLLHGPEAGEVPEPTLDPSLVAQPSRIRQPTQIAEGYPVGVEQDFAYHQPATTLEDAA
jgi:hypothetical protein